MVKLIVKLLCMLCIFCRTPGQYFTGDSNWGVEPVDVSSTNQEIYRDSVLSCNHIPIVPLLDVALYDDYVIEI